MITFPSGANLDLVPVSRFLALLLLGSFSLTGETVEASTETGFTIHGRVLHPPQEGGEIVLKRVHVLDRRETTLQSIELDGEGEFMVRLSGEPGIFEIDFYGIKKARLALDYGQEVRIDLSLKNLERQVEEDEEEYLKITGSPDTDLLLDYEKFRQESLQRLVVPVRQELEIVRGASEPDTGLIGDLTAKEVANYSQHRVELVDFAMEKLGHSIALYAAALRWDAEQDLEILEDMVGNFKKAHPGLKISGKLDDTVSAFGRIALGSQAMEIELPDSSGELQKLSSYRGNFVLVDFWASWCPPCRVENPNYASIYEKYHERGFEIYAVSIDTNRIQWLKASDKDGIVWTNVSDLKAYNSPAVRDYSVSALPVNLLLDREGRIIARNLRGEALREKIAQLLP